MVIFARRPADYAATWLFIWRAMFEAASLLTRQEYSSGYVHTAVLYSILLGFRIFGNRAARASDRTQSIAALHDF